MNSFLNRIKIKDLLVKLIINFYIIFKNNLQIIFLYLTETQKTKFRTANNLNI